MALTCDANGIAEAAKCLQNPCITEADRMAIGVLLAAYTLVAAGGEDYTANLDQLISDSVGLQVYGHNVYRAEDLAVALESLLPFSSTVDDLLESVKCLRCQSLKALRKALLFLQCATAAEA